MPDYIDPAWEYWTPDPEIAEVIGGQFRLPALDLLGFWEDDDRKGAIRGFRIGRGDPNRWIPVRLAPPKRKVCRELLPKKICLQCHQAFQPVCRDRIFCSVLCKCKYQVGKCKPQVSKCKPQVRVRSSVTCRECGKDFIPKASGQLFCGLSCANAYRNHSKRKADYDLILKMYIRGDKVESIARECGVSGATVQRVVRRLDASLRRPPGNRSRSNGRQ